MANKKIFIIIFSLAFLMRLVTVFFFAEEKSLLHVNDSQTYLQTAKNIIKHGVYSMEISDTPHPDNFRTPLYPLFLIPFVWLKTSLYVPAIIQSFLMSIGVGLFFVIGQKIFNRHATLMAAILFALEPLGALFSVQIMTEAIFTPLFVLAILLLILHLKTRTNQTLLLASSILLALAALTRPIAFYLFIIIPIAIYFTKNDWRLKAKQILISLGIFFLIVSPWLFFIIFKVHSYSFSSIIGMQMYEYHARYLDEWRSKHETPPNDRLPYVDLSPINDTLNARAIPPIKAEGVAYIKAHLSQYTLFYLSRIPYLFLDSGYTTVLNGISPRINQSFPPLITLTNLFFGVIFLLALLNVLFHYKINHSWRKETILLLIVILLYATISAPISAARFRIPINFFLFLLAFDTIFMLRQIKIINAKNNF